MYHRQQGQGVFIPIPGFPPGSSGNTTRRLDRLERQVDRLDQQIDRINRRLDRIERRLNIGSNRYNEYY